MEFRNPFPSLLGMNNQEPDPYQSLLGGYYTPQQARRAWLGGTLQGLGAGLASGKSGAWAQGLALGGGEGLDNYRQRAVAASALDMRKKEYDYQQQQRQEEAAARQAEEEAQAAWLANPGDKNLFAKAYPKQYAQQYAQTLFPDPQGSGGDAYFGTPIPYTKPDGSIGYGLPSKSGGFKPLDAPGSFLSPYDKAYQQGAGGVAGKTQEEQKMTAPADIQAADMALDLLDQIVTDPYLERGTGFSSLGNSIPGTGGYDFQNIVDQAKSGAFLTAVQQMKGLGALSNNEGQAATAAITRMNTATSKDAFLKAVADYREIIEVGRDRALKRVQSPPTAPNAPAANGAPAEDPLGLR